MFIPEYEDLIKRVEAIDPAAAEYLRTEAPKLEDFEFQSQLLTSFGWGATPQGFTFWGSIARRLGEDI